MTPQVIVVQFAKGKITMKGTFSVTFTVEPATLSVATPEDLGVVNEPVKLTAVEISGGTPPYTVSNIIGSLPAGVTINPDGSITGTPTMSGSFPVSLDVADSLG